jgi:hypothetical protein
VSPPVPKLPPAVVVPPVRVAPPEATLPPEPELPPTAVSPPDAGMPPVAALPPLPPGFAVPWSEHPPNRPHVAQSTALAIRVRDGLVVSWSMSSCSVRRIPGGSTFFEDLILTEL